PYKSLLLCFGSVDGLHEVDVLGLGHGESLGGCRDRSMEPRRESSGLKANETATHHGSLHRVVNREMLRLVSRGDQLSATTEHWMMNTATPVEAPESRNRLDDETQTL